MTKGPTECPRCKGSGWTVERMMTLMGGDMTVEEYPSEPGADGVRTCGFCHGVGSL